MTQPATPVAYSDGKGTRNVYCLACPRPPEATVRLTAEDIDHWETCRACGRYVVDAARTVTTDPTPGTEPEPTAPAPVDPALAQRIARAVRDTTTHIADLRAFDTQIAAAVLAELAPELERLRKAERAVNLLADSHRRAERAETALTRVRELHARSDTRRSLDLSLTPVPHCTGCGEDWPCPTTTALTGPAEENTP